MSQAARPSNPFLLFGAAPDTEARVIVLSFFSAFFCMGLQTVRMTLDASEVWIEAAASVVTRLESCACANAASSACADSAVCCRAPIMPSA